MSDSDTDSVSPLTSGESEEEDLLEKFESLQQKRNFQTTLPEHLETWAKQDGHRVSTKHYGRRCSSFVRSSSHSRHSFQEKMSSLTLTVGELYNPIDTLYSLVGDVGKDYGGRQQQTSAMINVCCSLELATRIFVAGVTLVAIWVRSV